MNKAWLINIGNTHSEFAWFDNGDFSIEKRLPTQEMLADSHTHLSQLNAVIYPCIIACVVPAVKVLFNRMFTPDRLVWISAELELGIDLSVVDKSTIGADRLANMVAAINHFSLPVMILDCGTAITTAVVDADKRFLGGSIMPGRELSRWGLNQRTGQLPTIDLTDMLPGALGKTTREAIKAGVDWVFWEQLKN
jgi:type III pantothenate kinase